MCVFGRLWTGQPYAVSAKRPRPAPVVAALQALGLPADLPSLHPCFEAAARAGRLATVTPEVLASAIRSSPNFSTLSKGAWVEPRLLCATPPRPSKTSPSTSAIA